MNMKTHFLKKASMDTINWCRGGVWSMAVKTNRWRHKLIWHGAWRMHPSLLNPDPGTWGRKQSRPFISQQMVISSDSSPSRAAWFAITCIYGKAAPELEFRSRPARCICKFLPIGPLLFSLMWSWQTVSNGWCGASGREGIWTGGQDNTAHLQISPKT